MKYLYTPFLLITLFCHSAWAQDRAVETKELGNLLLKTSTIDPVTAYMGKEVMAEVSVLPGQSYIFKSPIDVQQIEYLKGAGDEVTKNLPFAIIKGPEVHHFYMAYQMKKRLLTQSTALFENSKKLYKRKSLSEQSWLDMSNQYHDTKMEFDELTHFFDLVLSFDPEAESLTLAAPISGFLNYSLSKALNNGGLIASFVPLEALRLKVNLPIGLKDKPLHIISGRCHLEIDFIENANSAFFQTFWTKALNSDCPYVQGQVINVTPEYQTSAYKVKQSSVFNWEGDNFIFVKNEQGYIATQVELITSHGDTYIVTSEVSLLGKSTLISSVSAVQGILIGLGK